MKLIKDNTVNIFDICSIFINELEDVSPKKLQKLLYFTEAWFMADNSDIENEEVETLFFDDVYAWKHGPVYKNVYNEYKIYGWRNIEKEENYKRPALDSILDNLIDEILKMYGTDTANELELASHLDNEWKEKFDSGNGLSSMRKTEIFIEYSNKYE